MRSKIRSTIPAKGYRVYYVRYADAFLIGVNGTYDQADKIRSAVAKFLRENLNLKLNMDNTHITNASKSRANFLDAEIIVLSSLNYDQKFTLRSTSSKRRVRARVPNSNVVILAPIEMIAKRLQDLGMCRINN